MSRIKARFDALKAANRAAFIPFISAGDPDAATSAALLESLPGAGADLIELGMPFTDPMADGPAVQASSLRALKSGATMASTFDMVRGFRSKDIATPVILMGYFNPVHAWGAAKFAADAAAAGVDGLIIVDLPPEEDETLRTAANKAGIDMIRLVTPTTDAARLGKVLNGASGFLYYVSVAGVTGTKSFTESDVRDALTRIRAASSLPVAVGFGIRTPEQAGSIAKFADAVVVGSAIVALAEAVGPAQLVAKTGELCRALAGSTHDARNDKVRA